MEDDEIDTLGDVVIVITSQCKNDEGEPFPITKVFRFDLENAGSNAGSLIEHIEQHHAVIEGGKMRNVE